MKSSNLAERLEELAATVETLETSQPKPTLLLAFVTGTPPRPAPAPSPRRSMLGARRIEIRDDGLRPFRVS